MRGLISVIFILGAVAVAYAIHWSRKAVATVHDASVLLRQTGSFGETLQQLLLERHLPDSMRLSPSQRAYVVQHQQEFERLYGAAIEAQARTEFSKWESRNPNAGPLDVEGAIKAASLFAAINHARIFCESRRVA
jgi:hypothetical protein